VVFLLETMLAFPDKDALAGEWRACWSGRPFRFHGRGRPAAHQQERARMPGADTVWPSSWRN